MKKRCCIPALAFLLLAPLPLPAQRPSTIPHLEKHGDVTQLMVDGKPYVMLAGELFNSSSSSLAYMQPEWAKLSAMGLNTVFTPVSWDLVEPTEGHYDFALVDGLLAQAREQHMHIVFLWLAAWKNGMSGYPPVWVEAGYRALSARDGRRQSANRSSAHFRPHWYRPTLPPSKR